MSKFLLLLHGGKYDGYSETELENILAKYIAWTQKLQQDGVLIASEELKDTGRMLFGRNNKIVDGPYTETKEAIGGFYLYEARDYDAAESIARDCPHLEFQGTVEIREINPH